jgi:pSer/pThr/pTyr-binding forkhead associated (FHA) protein
MKVVLVLFNANGQPRSFSISHQSTTIGRRQDCDLRIPVAQVSRKHCRLVKDEQTVRLEDLDSSNGTYHNGQRVAGAVNIQPGDSIQVGPVVFILQIDGVPADEELPSLAERAGQNQVHLPSNGEATASPSGPQDAFDITEPHVVPTDDQIDLDDAPQSTT